MGMAFNMRSFKAFLSSGSLNTSANFLKMSMTLPSKLSTHFVTILCQVGSTCPRPRPWACPTGPSANSCPDPLADDEPDPLADVEPDPLADCGTFPPTGNARNLLGISLAGKIVPRFVRKMPPTSTFVTLP